MISSSVTDSLKTGTSSQSASTSGAKSATNSLGKDAFLKLLVTQLQNQDPLKPMDDQQFIAQMAQFSSLEEMQNISKSIDSMTSSQASATKTNAVGFIGKNVTAIGGNIKISGGTVAPLQYDLAKDASTVTVSINDASGKTVKVLNLSNVTSGTKSVSWDGRDTQGNRLPDGDYTLQVKAVDESGNNIQANTLMTGVVNSVSYDQGGTYLIIGSAKVSLDDVKSVK